ncbi:MAG: phenylpyruvate tautomerase MIF-related protein [Bacilli bacterium]|jgi:phenylpyruvate tautomerase PptA (4-oxalocrotonate tautomerase family)
MPFIQLKTSASISGEKETILKDLFGKAISLLPGKSEEWLMVSFEEKKHLYFQGSKDKDSAILEVKVYGKAEPEDYEKLTGKLTEIVSSVLSLSPERIYVEYEETPTWGFAGSNF